MSFEIKEATRKIPLTKGMFATISSVDFSIVSGVKWYAMKTKRAFYAASNRKGGRACRGTILMHRLILGVCKSDQVDHRNGNGLDNTRLNLRVATRSLNAVNSKRSGSSSKYRGVVWDSSRGKWAAYMKVDGKTVNLGRFKTESQAASAYKRAAYPIYKDFINHPNN